MKFIKYALMLVVSNLVRMIRIIPNVDPIMGAMLPFAKQDKWWEGALFAIIAMLSFDIITNSIGIWTLVTAGTYGALGIVFHFYYQGKKIGLKHYVLSGITGVLFFDLITGVLFGPTLFGTSYYEAFIGQIPFTALHLLSVTAFVLVLTPLLDKHIVENPQLDDKRVISRFLSWKA